MVVYIVDGPVFAVEKFSLTLLLEKLEIKA
jgi:hypothetical protein